MKIYVGDGVLDVPEGPRAIPHNSCLLYTSALNDVSISIEKGEFCCIVGQSGSGKSTLLNQLAGLEKPWTVISKSTASPSGLPEAGTGKNLKNKSPAKRQESHNELV